VTDVCDLPEILRNRDPGEILEALESEEVLELADVIGPEAALRLVAAYGGQAVYLPKLDQAVRRFRNAEIREAFNGANAAELARRHNLSQARVYAIVCGRGEDDARPEQQRLF
jgi:Mor family transcriptional regulator